MDRRKVLIALSAPVALAWGTTASAEKLNLDHRLYAPLNAAVMGGGDEAVFFDDSNPNRVLDRILVRGTSAERNWTEALELIVLPRNRSASPRDWYQAFRPDAESPCANHSNLLGSDDQSLTFSVETPACASGPAFTGLYRVVYGKRTIYLVGAKYKGVMTPDQRQQWLALLATASIQR